MSTKDLKSLGENLKIKRKERNLSLKEVENATSIRMSYLQAIEEGDMNKMISPIYAQGFTRQYATYLGVDSDPVLREHPELFSRQSNQEDEDFSYGIGTLEKRGNPGSGVKSTPNILWIFAVAALFVAAWYLAKYLDLI